ncbi:hypothetical protein Pcinc_034359 [Petrolisthes cinctipes]|uniref:Uncharacterized protein n=1 Tax=Petrolisthes cinctipes TaxID=88211 RepID=A0AAE1EQF8_PETCI|nr:hypothetical protein Pcinc_034359 [Petrolisthes cinctipes]
MVGNQQLNLGKEVQRQRYKSEPKHSGIEPNKESIGEPREEVQKHRAIEPYKQPIVEPREEVLPDVPKEMDLVESRQGYSSEPFKPYPSQPSKHYSDSAKQEVTRIHSMEEKDGAEEEKAKVGRGRGRAALLHSHQANTQTIQPGANPVGEKSDSQEVLSDKCESVTESLQHFSLQDQQEQREVIVRQGTSGVRFSALTNYIRLNLDENKAVFEYEVKFDPDVDAINLRHRFVSLFKDQLSTAKTFDGVTLWLPIRLPNEITIFQTPHPLTQETVTLKVIYKKRSELSRCIQLYNVLFSRIMKVLRMARVGRNHYAPGESILVPQHKLEIWPGYVTAASYQEGGLMLVVDVSHRVLRTETTYQALTDIYHMHSSEFKPKAIQALVGCIVLTRYNNRTYRIDDILFDQNPLSTFTNYKEEEMKYVDYYKASYNINIVDPKQPLLLHRIKKKDLQHKDQTRFLCLVPELCYMTGMTQTMRSDFRVMKDVAHHTRITPTLRQAALRKFISNVNGNTEAKTVLMDWGLTLEDNTVGVDGRILAPENIYFANKDVPGTQQADWGTHTFREKVIQPVDIMSGCWLILYSYRDQPRAQKFVDMLKQVTQNVGIRVGEPQMVQLPDDRTETYVTSLKHNYSGQIQVAVIIFPTQREDRYSAVKRLACAELALPTQCINSRTISQDHKLRAVTLKIALQINCKLGGELWAVKIPLNGVMVCGIDVYHDPASRGASVVGFVASSNHTLTRWYSRVTFQNKADEVIHGLKISLLEALKHYHKNHHSLPRSIIVYRDGVGDGQLQLVEDHEVPQLTTIFLHFDSYKPKLSYVVVQKRINARIFAVMNARELGNPPPGSIVDHTITRPYWYDFLLVSQHVRQGTISPTHYIVVQDTSNLKVDNMQRLTYKLTHLYYNWPGTVRVPAPCLYAHKLAYLVGESVRKEPAAKLSDKLYFL